MQEQRLGSRYLLAGRLGGGGMGEVFLAHTGTGDQLAVKVLRSELAEDPDLVSRFLQESRLLRRLQHPNVVRVLDLVAEGDRFGIVMEFVPDGDLRRAVPIPCPAPASLVLLAQVADGLAVIHAAGITHRDLKPENVLVQRLPDGSLRARVTDFGVSHPSDSLSTRHNGIVGTAAYLSPESAKGMRAGPPGDVYALGVMLYEMCVGRRPFVAENPLAVIRAHAELPISRPPMMSTPVWDLLSAMTAKNPEDRPTAAEAAHRLWLLTGSRTRMADAGGAFVPVASGGEPAQGRVPVAVAGTAATDPDSPTLRAGACGDQGNRAQQVPGGALGTIGGAPVTGDGPSLPGVPELLPLPGDLDPSTTGAVSRRGADAGAGSRREWWRAGRGSLIVALAGVSVLLVGVGAFVLLHPSDGGAPQALAAGSSTPGPVVAVPDAGPVSTTSPAASVTPLPTVPTSIPAATTSSTVPTTPSDLPGPGVPSLEIYQPAVSSLETVDSKVPLSIRSVDPGAGTVASIAVLYDTGTQSVQPRARFAGPYYVTVTGLQNGRPYTFRVRVCNSHDKCATSPGVRFTPYTLPSLGPLSAEASALRVTITWPSLDLNGNPRTWSCQLTVEASWRDRRAPIETPVQVGGGSIIWRAEGPGQYSAVETCSDGTQTVSGPALTFRVRRPATPDT